MRYFKAKIGEVEIGHKPKYHNFSLWERFLKKIQKFIVKVGRKKWEIENLLNHIFQFKKGLI